MMTKLEAKVVVAALVWHARNVFSCRALHTKQDKDLRLAAINLLTKQDDKFTVKRLQIAKGRRSSRA